MGRNSRSGIPEASSVAARPRLLYGTVFVWLAVTGGRFFAPLIEEEGVLSVGPIGGILAVQQAVGLVTNPWAGRIADRATKQQESAQMRVSILAAGAVCGTLVFLLIGTKRVFPNRDVFSSWEWFLFLRILYAMAVSFVMPVLDGLCLHYLGEGRKQDYGKERLWGAVTWAVANLLLGPAFDYSGGFGISYPLALVACGGVLVSAFVYVRSSSKESSTYGRIDFDGSDDALPEVDAEVIAPKEETPENDEDTEEGVDKQLPDALDFQPSTRQLLRRLLWDPSSSIPYFGAFFFLALVVLAFGQVIVESLVFLFFADDLGGSYTLMGWTVVLTVIFEIPVFAIADQLLLRFGSTPLLLLAMLCYIVRVLGYSFIPHGHVVYALFLEPLHGVTFACSQTAAVDFVARHMPAGAEATGQGLIYMFRGGGAILGLLVGGLVQETFGARVLYRVAAVLVATGCGALCIAFISLRVNEERTKATKHCDVTECDEDELELTTASSR
jgi:MFS family permease